MRKLFWFGCAASVTAAAFVFVTARHAHKHPVSLVGHLVHGAYVATGWSNPVFQACRSMGARMAFTVGRTLAPETVQTPCEATPCCTSMAPRCEPAPCEIPQVIDLTQCEQMEVPTGNWYRPRPQYIPPSPDYPLERELEFMQQQQAAKAAPATVIVTAGEVEEAEPVVPTTMPPADAEDEINAFRQLKDGLIWQELCEVEQQNATEVEQLPMPRELEELPETTEPGDEAGGVEQGEPPDCQEMPEIDQHKSGCPSMGGCPYTGRCPTPPSYPIGKDRE